MSSFRKALKSKQRDHKERSQPGSRKHLGLLEKKKDYKLRADDYHRKQKTLNALRKKALDKNPDEFYYKMINTQLKDGEHVIKQKEEQLTEEQKKIMRTQDIGYVEMKRVAESKTLKNTRRKMSRVPSHLREQAIGLLQGGMRTADVDRAINCNVCNVRRLRQCYRETGRTADRPCSGKLHPDVIENLQMPWWKSGVTSHSKN
ncbi:probable U3 small nucleolar RNA-associated protein 11 isoform X2 [Ictalurus furcatus]|uniref:probable U3 small nucleolar RNA-associated protein 11 isoform X2 n=1 Tax=Ictalurus furcatus TaxID=66913 RepID=UPI002350EB9C|nr:probable U3 small nucleolar RNA-associated protein 11 isoform X2 [Ictalurus furcatus]